MMPTTRQIVLAGSLALTLGATVWVAREDDAREILAPVPAKAVARRELVAGDAVAQAMPPVLDLDLFRERQNEPAREHVVVNGFANKSFLPPPPPPPNVATFKPEPPAAPPLPFSYAGRLQGDDGRWVFYLMRGEQSFSVAEGEEFDTAYRLQAVEKDKLVIEYLPLAIRQFLPLDSE